MWYFWIEKNEQKIKKLFLGISLIKLITPPSHAAFVSDFKTHHCCLHIGWKFGLEGEILPVFLFQVLFNSSFSQLIRIATLSELWNRSQRSCICCCYSRAYLFSSFLVVSFRNATERRLLINGKNKEWKVLVDFNWRILLTLFGEMTQ